MFTYRYHAPASLQQTQVFGRGQEEAGRAKAGQKQCGPTFCRLGLWGTGVGSDALALAAFLAVVLGSLASLPEAGFLAFLPVGRGASGQAKLLHLPMH